MPSECPVISGKKAATRGARDLMIRSWHWIYLFIYLLAGMVCNACCCASYGGKLEYEEPMTLENLARNPVGLDR